MIRRRQFLARQWTNIQPIYNLGIFCLFLVKPPIKYFKLTTDTSKTGVKKVPRNSNSWIVGVHKKSESVNDKSQELLNWGIQPMVGVEVRPIVELVTVYCEALFAFN